MLLLTALGGLITCLIAAAGVIGVQLQALTPANFKDSTSTGLWFIEYYSPRCPHCKNFAPTWEKLVRECATEIPSVHLAQVDCLTYGDICNDNNVGGYPTMMIHEDGKRLEVYSGSRQLDDLKKFINRFVKPVEEPSVEVEDTSLSNVNSRGELLSIPDATVLAETLQQGPVFVKFFAPWCGHCKKLAPTWAELAHQLKGKVTVAEVDCEAHSKLCTGYNIQGYPTLVYFTNSLRTEYTGERSLDHMKAFAEKAAQAGLHPLQSDSELDDLVQKHDVVYLLLDSGKNVDVIRSARERSVPLFGSPPAYISYSKKLFARYNVPPTSTWALLAFKDHDISKPSGHLYGYSQTPLTQMSTWFMKHRLPTFLELGSDSFQDVMNSPQQPLVLIAAVNDKTRGKVQAKLEKLAADWKVRTDGTGEKNGRQVVFTWMDGEKWKDWLKSMYGIKYHDEDDLDDVRVVIADHARLVYYERDARGHKIDLTKDYNLLATVEKATAGVLRSKHSQNPVERLARYLNHKLSGVEYYVTAHPYKSVFFIVAGIVLVFTLLIKWLGKSLPRDRENVKSSRLD